MYCPFPTSYPLMMSGESTSSPVSPSTLRYLMRLPVWCCYHDRVAPHHCDRSISRRAAPKRSHSLCVVVPDKGTIEACVICGATKLTYSRGVSQPSCHSREGTELFSWRSRRQEEQ